MEQTIYVDVLLALNLFVNFFLLLSVKNFFHLKASRLRLVLGASAGAAASLIILLPRLSELICAAITLAVSVIIIFISFFPLGGLAFIKATAAFYIFNFSYAGMMLFIWYFISPEILFIKNNIVYFKISPLFLCVVTVIVYFSVNAISKLMGKREADELFCEAQIYIGENKIKAFCKIDTGNSLREPFSQSPVMIASSPHLKNLNLPFRVVPYKDVSGGGILKAYCADKIIIKQKGKECENTNCYVAFLEGGFPGGFDAVINPEIISEGVVLGENNK